MDMPKDFACLKLDISYSRRFTPLPLHSSTSVLRKLSWTGHNIYPFKLIYFNTIQYEFVHVQIIEGIDTDIQISQSSFWNWPLLSK